MIKKINLLNFSIIFFFLLLGSFQSILPSNSSQMTSDPEYNTGKVAGDYMNLTYVWIKTNQTYFISVSMYDEIYKAAPFNPMFGQIISINDTDVFIGTIIKGFELYIDSNNNQVLDQKSEIKYFIMLNASQLVVNEPVNVEKINENLTRFTWKTIYYDIDGFLMPFDSSNRIAYIDSFNLSYTFDISNEYSQLKLSIEMGDWHAYTTTFENGQIIPVDPIDLSNYGLSMLFGTVIGTTDDLQSNIGGTNDLMHNASYLLNNSLIFKTTFDETYNLIDSNENYISKTVVATNDSLYSDQWVDWNTPQDLITWWFNFYPTLTEETPIPQLANDKLVSLYRICYPVFGGKAFSHDPRYTAYFVPNPKNIPNPTTIQSSLSSTSSS
ncbi:MAG: hypothetical protein ACFFD1_12750, partial [Candidatus Thorarchaeota archaeon]